MSSEISLDAFLEDGVDVGSLDDNCNDIVTYYICFVLSLEKTRR